MDTPNLEAPLVDRLKEFARIVIQENCWGYSEPDGGEIQDLAERLGLIYPTIATADDCDEDFSEFTAGDEIYKLSPELALPPVGGTDV